MSIKIREPELQHEVSLSRSGWLTVLAFLSECHDSASTEAMVEVVGGVIKAARGFVLAKEKAQEFKLPLSREQALDLYLFFGEFKTVVEGQQVLESVQQGFKSFLIGGDE